VSAPLYALLFLAQRPTAWTLTGGALILAAGVLVVLFGKAEVEPMA
jgi:drug/metabolite transporter (DMT)-like permease